MIEEKVRVLVSARKPKYCWSGLDSTCKPEYYYLDSTCKPEYYYLDLLVNLNIII